jgi:hypothetical protein
MVAVSIRSLEFGAIAVVAAAVSRPATATPFIDVTAIWEVDASVGWYGPIPSDVSVTCGGDASGSGDCSDSLSVIRSVTHNETASVSRFGTVTLTNTGTVPTGDFSVRVGWSAFNPGGPDVGLGIDNGQQSAFFESEVSISDNFLLFTGETHSCGVPGGPGDLLSATTCGLSGPDESFVAWDISSLAPGESTTAFAPLSISDRFSGIPEPTALSILGSGVVALGLLRRRQRLG